MASAIVLKTAKKKLGLDECELFVSGAAPIATEVLSYFGSVDINVVEVYGMSENTGPMTVVVADKWTPGTVGWPLDGVELRLDHVAGRDREGEGEVGRLNSNGTLSITGRIKELIITEGGENIA